MKTRSIVNLVTVGSSGSSKIFTSSPIVALFSAPPFKKFLDSHLHVWDNLSERFVIIFYSQIFIVMYYNKTVVYMKMTVFAEIYIFPTDHDIGLQFKILKFKSNRSRRYLSVNQIPN